MPQPSVNWRNALTASVAVTVALVGCASVPDPYAVAPASEQLARADALGDCMRRLRDLDARIDAAGVRDAQAARVDGYPFLRVDRFTASRSPGDRDAAAVAQAKLDRMAALDAEAREVRRRQCAHCRR